MQLNVNNWKKMGVVHFMPWYPNFHIDNVCGLPPSCVCRLGGWPIVTHGLWRVRTGHNEGWNFGFLRAIIEFSQGTHTSSNSPKELIHHRILPRNSYIIEFSQGTHTSSNSPKELIHHRILPRNSYIIEFSQGTHTSSNSPKELKHHHLRCTGAF